MNEREKQLLEAIIRLYLENGESVGSRTIEKKYNFGISSATIRNTMSDLEDEGFLKKMHTSSGRVPTVKGYKLYLKEFLNDDDTNYRREIIDRFNFENIDPENVFKSISSILGNISNGIGFVIEHKLDKNCVSNLELVYVNDREAYIVLVLNHKTILTSTISFYNIMSENQVKEINKYIKDILNVVENDVKVEDIIKFLNNLGKISTDISGNKKLDSKKIYVDGILNLIEGNDFELDKSLNIVKYILDDKERLNIILEKSNYKMEEINVVFLDDINEEVLSDMVMITKTYKINERTVTIGVLSNIRLNYEHIFSYINSIRDVSEYIINRNSIRKMIR